MRAPRAPEKWFIESARESGYAIISVESHGHQAFARVVVQMEDEANDDPRLVKRATLIAAAPDLLSALLAVFDEVKDYPEKKPTSMDSFLPSEFREQIRAALVKAGVP